MNCVLHIGTEKTGSTLLQDWLYLNQDQLSAQRIFLSDTLGFNNNRRIVSYFQSELDDWTQRNSLQTQAEKDAYFEHFLDEFSEEVKTASKTHDHYVITSEHFHSRLRKKEEIHALKECLEKVFTSVTVVCYFREQMQTAKSLYSTALKGPYVTALEDFMDAISPSNYYYNYKAIADNWSGAFGKSNCMFKIYDRDKFIDQDIRKDFLACFNRTIDVEKLDFTISSSNESLSSLEGELYRVINGLVPFWKDENGYANPENTRIKTQVSAMENVKIGNIVDPRSAAVSERFLGVNKEFFDEYFNGENLFKVPPAPTNDQTEKSMLTVDQVGEIISIFLEELIPDKTPSNELLDSDADWLRDIALKQERDEKLTPRDAFLLMQLANKARPEGPLIKQKLADIKLKLAS